MSYVRKEDMSPMPMMRTVILDNDEAVGIGDSVKWLNGNLEAVNANAVAGIIIDIVDKNGASIWGSTAKLGSATLTNSATPNLSVVTVASNNETVDLIAAKIDISPFTIYSASILGTMNDTNASNKPGGWVDGSDQRTIDETTHSRTIGTSGVFQNHGVDPDDSTRMLVSIHESEIFNTGTDVT